MAEFMKFREILFFGTVLCLTQLPSLVVAAEQGLTETLRDFVQRNQRRQAYGVYLKDQKFGWAIDEFKLGQHQGKDVAVYSFEMHGRFASAGESSTFQDLSSTCYSLEGEGEIVFAEQKTTEDGHETIRTVVRDGQDLIVTTQSAAGTAKRRVPTPRETVGLMQRLEAWLARPPKRGETFASYSTAWEQEEVETKETITFRGAKSMVWGGVKTDIYLVKINIEGMSLDFEVLADGTPVKGMLGGFFELRAEKESMAKTLGEETVDLLLASSIKVNKPLGDPEAIERLTLKIRGPRDAVIPGSHRQRIVSRRGRTFVLELDRDFRSPRPQPLAPAERSDFLKATPMVQCDDERIRSLAREIVGTETDPLEQARRLQGWVFDNLRQSMASNASSALDVLHKKAGDCTELTLLFVALARAAGLPAREVGGVMYAEEEIPMFGWHAWAEIHDGHQWVSVDPTWNQVFVDAAHIKFSEDPKDWSWVNLLGKLEIEVVKIQKRK